MRYLALVLAVGLVGCGEKKVYTYNIHPGSRVFVLETVTTNKNHGWVCPDKELEPKD